MANTSATDRHLRATPIPVRPKRWAAAAGAGGAAFVVLLWSIATLSPAGLGELGQLHRQNPSFFLIDLLPLVAAGAAYWVALRLRASMVALRLAEAQLRRQRRDLEQALAQRQQKLSGTIEHQQQLMSKAGESSQAKDRYLANMSHEIRTPMNGILGMVELMAESGLTVEQREYNEAIRRAGESLLAIINDILDLSKIEADKMELEREDFAVVEVVEDSLEIVARAAFEKDLDISHVVAPEVPAMARGDRGRVQQILVNLLSNAVKFTDEGQITVEVELKPGDGGKQYLKFSVVDTGVGVPPDQMEGVFRSYTRSRESSPDPREGTGLGLAISRRFAQLMGGRIGIEKRDDPGSCFWFTVEFESSETTMLPVDLEDLEVLVVSESHNTRRMLQRLLSRWNANVRTSCDGPAALGVLADAIDDDRPVRLLIADLHLAGMTGLQLADGVGQDESLGKPEVILITRVNDRRGMNQAVRRGYDRPVSKPLRSENLLQAIHHRLNPTELVEESRLTPSTNPEEAVAGVADIVRSTARRPEGSTTSYRVLVADDNAVNRRVASLILNKAGHSTDEACDGEEAVQRIREERFDLVLMDVQMPRMDGFGATAAIRELPGRKGRTPIVAMTARAMTGDSLRCIEAGMDGYVSKPVKAEALLAAVESWASRDEDADEVDVPPARPRESSAPVVDESALDELRDYGGESADSILEELVTMFLDGAGDQLTNLRTAIESDDVKTLERTIHTLKGGAGTLGARRVAEMCLLIEAAVREGEPVERSQIDELESEIEAVRDYMTSKL